MFSPAPYNGNDLPSFINYVIGQLQVLSNQFAEFETDYVRFTEMHTAPDKPALGMVFLADGSDWDPLTVGGSDPYFVWYTGSAYRGLHETGNGTNLT